MKLGRHSQIQRYLLYIYKHKALTHLFSPQVIFRVLITNFNNFFLYTNILTIFPLNFVTKSPFCVRVNHISHSKSTFLTILPYQMSNGHFPFTLKIGVVLQHLFYMVEPIPPHHQHVRVCVWTGRGKPWYKN